MKKFNMYLTATNASYILKKEGGPVDQSLFQFCVLYIAVCFFVVFLFLQWVVSLDFCSNLSLSLMRIFVNFCFLYYNRYIYRPLFYVKTKMRRMVVYINKGIKFAFLFIDMLFLKVSNKIMKVGKHCPVN